MTAELVDLLERAAAKIREHAEPLISMRDTCADIGSGHYDRQIKRHGGGPLFRSHFENWTPDAALLVADWLEGEAATIAAMEPLADLVGVTIQHTSGNEAHVQVGRTEAGEQRMQARTDSFAVALARSLLEED